MIQRNSIVLVFLLLAGVLSGNVTLFMGGNSWSLDKGSIKDAGYTFSTLPAKFASYIYTGNSAPASIQIKFRSNVTVSVQVTLGQQTLSLDNVAASSVLVTSLVGTFTFDVGYNRIDIVITGAVSAGSGVVESLFINGDLTGLTYVTDSSWFYWGRRGPSGHIRPKLPTATNVSYYYSEITVPAGYDKIASYFMANGFGEGYFGIQVNSATERRVLFSVWSGYSTNYANEVPKDWTVLLNKSGPGVTIGTFQGEGSGGQSYLIFPWVADTTYKFLTKAQPLVTDGTTYTSWFNDPNNSTNDGWRLIASWTRPKIRTYLKSFYHFVECFSTNTGNETRMAYYGNEWIYDSSNTWKESYKMQTTKDSTATNNQRRDVDGGVVDGNGNQYYLKNGGFFNTTTAQWATYTRTATGVAPSIDLSALNAMLV